MINGYSDEEILQKIRLGIPSNSEVVGWLYDRIRPVIYTIALNYGIQNEEDIQDLTQDVIEAFYSQVMDGKFRGHSAVFSYIYAIAKNKCIDRLRKYSETLYDPLEWEAKTEEPDYESPEVLIILAEKTAIFKAFLSLLSDSCRAIIDLQIGPRALSNQAIAEELGLSSAKYVATAIYRCKKNLATKILNDPILLGRLMDSFDDPFKVQKSLIKYVDDFDLLLAYCKGEALESEAMAKLQKDLAREEDLEKLITFLRNQLG